MAGLSVDQLVSSPACIPQMTLEEILPVYADLGFRKFEAFSGWCRSHLKIDQDPAGYVDLARQHGLSYTSFHLPPIGDDFEATLDQAIRAARFGQAIGADVVLYKANTRENYVKGARPFLDALDQQGIRVTPVLQNHKGTPITTLDDFREVIDGINDPRMKTLLEVGHFQRAGVSWRQGYDLLAGSIALVHINEIDPAGKSVPYGTGIVDFRGLFEQLAQDGYRGNIVVELELETRDTDSARTIRCLEEAVRHLAKLM